MGFDLANMLKDVPNPNTGRQSITYIPLDKILPDERNFYLLTGLDKLAENIEFCGLQAPIVVRKRKEDDCYTIVSGHRRRAAIEILAKDDPKRWREIPCIIEADDVSPEMQELRLIYANCNTRDLTSAEISQQAERVQELLYQLKESGVEFPGRMRDHVAEAVGVSKTKLAKLKVIREKLTPGWESMWKKGKLNEAVAYALAQLSEEYQELIYNGQSQNKYLYENTVKNYADSLNKIKHLKCHDTGAPCRNLRRMQDRIVYRDSRAYDNCRGCCLDCSSLKSCKASCPRADAKKKEIKETEKKANRDAAQREAERTAPIIAATKSVYKRIEERRNALGMDFDTLKEHFGMFMGVNEYARRTAGDGIYANTATPLGKSIDGAKVLKIVELAEALGCSIDWLLTGKEHVPGSGTGQNPDTPLNSYCITGLSPCGHCGAAAYCANGVECCSQCDDPCNSKCGWLPEAAHE